MEDISVHKIPFEGNILIIGYGAVARCTLPLLVTHIEVPISNITVIDALDKTEELASFIEKGLTFKVLTIGRANLASVLSQHLTQGDLLIDLAYEIDTLDLLKWCREAGVLYTNASVEEWDPFGKTSVYDKTLYYRHMRIREVTSNWVNKKGERTGATAVLDHGANPGLISHFVKKGLIDIAHAGLKDGKFDPVLAREITDLIGKLNNKNLRREAFAQLAMKLDVKVIHCSERDTQISNKPRAIGEFVNTWSVEGLYEEGIAPAEMGWGTHERELPANSVVPPEGQRNQIFLDQWGMNTWVKSFVPPAHDIVGMVIRHGEAFTISEHLSVLSPDKNTTLYRPTVHYAYLPCDQAVASLHELRGRKSLQPKIRILDDRDITQGEDILGALLMGHAYASWWTGSLLTIDMARKLVPGQNATTVQVASGLLGAILWMIRNPQEGVCVPDDLPHDFILNVAKPYLGDFLSGPHDWAPDAEETNRPLWQFSSFVYNM